MNQDWCNFCFLLLLQAQASGSGTCMQGQGHGDLACQVCFYGLVILHMGQSFSIIFMVPFQTFQCSSTQQKFLGPVHACMMQTRPTRQAAHVFNNAWAQAISPAARACWHPSGQVPVCRQPAGAETEDIGACRTCNQ